MSDVVQPGTEPRPAGSRRLKYALIASLALNLAIIGAVAGTMYTFSHQRRPFMGHRGEDFGLMGLTRHLSEDRKKAIRKELRDDRVKLRPLIEDLRASRREAAAKLAAEPFDKAALGAAIVAADEKDKVLKQAAINAFLDHAERLTSAERRMLADWWLRKNEPFRERRRKKADTTETKAEAKDVPDAATADQAGAPAK